MAAYLIAHVKVKDAQKMQEYGAQAGATFAPFGGAAMVRGKVVEVLAGAHAGQAALIAKFPDAKSARDWYNSPAYQALIPLRDEAMEPTFVLIEEPTA
jgi:uncharacterized protein (DUF1330 family)